MLQKHPVYKYYDLFFLHFNIFPLPSLIWPCFDHAWFIVYATLFFQTHIQGSQRLYTNSTFQSENKKQYISCKYLQVIVEWPSVHLHLSMQSFVKLTTWFLHELLDAVTEYITYIYDSMSSETNKALKHSCILQLIIYLKKMEWK